MVYARKIYCLAGQLGFTERDCKNSSLNTQGNRWFILFMAELMYQIGVAISPPFFALPYVNVYEKLDFYL